MMFPKRPKTTNPTKPGIESVRFLSSSNKRVQNAFVSIAKIINDSAGIQSRYNAESTLHVVRHSFMVIARPVNISR